MLNSVVEMQAAIYWCPGIVPLVVARVMLTAPRLTHAAKARIATSTSRCYLADVGFGCCRGKVARIAAL